MATVSPCSKVCRIDARGLCEGCHRTRREIAVWGLLPDDEARAIMDTLPGRRAADPSAGAG
ncbi:MAG: DUF1289 domain-containing protein [Ilumatobacteraceae bacterium]